ncbi:hypothetical protein [Enhygromyxa salina]|uniref:hypothetical protein n=1 Tax=Enhygromyxa salina TaxID=215803 RepID=UPI000D022534|nr:hypothetical protein [Enhygromyxa salina]
MELRKQLQPGEGPPEAFPDRLIPAGLELANMLVFSKSNGSSAPDGYANVLSKFWAQVGHEPPSAAMTLVLMLTYVGAIGLVAMALAQLDVV